MPNDAGLPALGPHVLAMVGGIVVVTLILVMRNRRPRRLKLDRLWVRPVLAVVLIGGSLVKSPPPFTLPSVVVMLLALAVGVALGWQRGRLTQIMVDPATHEVTAKVSAVGVILVLGLVVAKYFLRSMAFAPSASSLLSAATLADALLLVTMATMSVQQIEISLRAHRLRDEVVAAGRPAS